MARGAPRTSAGRRPEIGRSSAADGNFLPRGLASARKSEAAMCATSPLSGRLPAHQWLGTALA
jgi:hypothetical protein